MFHNILDRIAARRAQRLASLLSPYLPARGSILDLGSGTGHTARAIAQSGRHIHEADVIHMGRPGTKPALFDGQALPFQDSSIDVVTGVFVLQYAASPAALLLELRRVSRTRIVVLQSVVRSPWRLPLLAATELLFGPLSFLAARALGYVSGSQRALWPRRMLTREQLLGLLEDAGFRIVSVVRVRNEGALLAGDLVVAEPAWSEQ